MKILFLVSLIFSFRTFAGDKVRNGGDYVRCVGNVAFFYDYYDLTRNKNITPVFPEIDGTFFDLAEAIISRQSDNDAAFKKLMHTYIEQMKSSVEFLDNTYERFTEIIEPQIDPDQNPLPEVNDNPALEISRRCKVGQAAVSGILNGAWHCEIYEPAWDLMSRENRSILILHEVIYRLAAQNGQHDSVNVVKLTQALLTSGKGLSGSKEIYTLRKRLNLLVQGEF